MGTLTRSPAMVRWKLFEENMPNYTKFIVSPGLLRQILPDCRITSAVLMASAVYDHHWEVRILAEAVSKHFPMWGGEIARSPSDALALAKFAAPDPQPKDLERAMRWIIGDALGIKLCTNPPKTRRERERFLMLIQRAELGIGPTVVVEKVRAEVIIKPSRTKESAKALLEQAKIVQRYAKGEPLRECTKEVMQDPRQSDPKFGACESDWQWRQQRPAGKRGQVEAQRGAEVVGTGKRKKK